MSKHDILGKSVEVTPAAEGDKHLLVTFTFHEDPGHGWLEVPREILNSLGDIKNHISPYSYLHGDNCYLEEDCDYARFHGAWIASGRDEFQVKTVYHDNECFIRNLRHYPATRGGRIQ